MRSSLTKVPSSTDPIDPYAFRKYHPNYRVVSVAGAHCGELNKDNPNNKLNDAAYRAMMRVVVNNRRKQYLKLAMTIK